MDNIAAMMQMSMPLQQVVGPKERPSHYKSVDAPQVGFQGQGNDLTPASDIQLQGRIKVIAANEALYDNWKGVASTGGAAQAPVPAGAGGMAALAAQTQGLIDRARPVQNFPVQMAGDHVSVATYQSQKPVVKIEQGRITGDKGVIQAYAAADRLYNMEAEYLGRDIKFPTADGKLHVELADLGSIQSGPRHSGGLLATPLGDEHSPRDPDVIAHEGGHAVLRAQRPEYAIRLPLTQEAEAVHEGFADSTALVASLQDKNVRADVIDKRKQGSLSNLASNIAEGASRHYDAKEVVDPSKPAPKAGEWPETKRIEPDARHGLRDLSHEPPRPGEAEKRFDGTEDPHDASRRFSSSFYRSVLDISDSIKQKNPGMSDDDALKQATNVAGKDLARATDFMPVLPNGGSQNDLARAVVTADRRDHDGEYGPIYAKNFGAASLDAEPPAMRAGLEGIRLSDRVAAAKPFEVKEGARRPLAGSDRAAADQFLKDNAGALQLEKGVSYRAQQLYHNNQGETFVTWSNGAHSQDDVATRFLRMGFDRDGKVIHESRQALPKLEPAPAQPR